MKNYRYVSQGEYFITQDPQTTLVTSGMTECIALVFIDIKNPNKRLLSHLDGLALESIENTKANIQFIISQFKSEVGCSEFNTYLLGGQKQLENWVHLTRVFEELGVSITDGIDAKQFCRALDEINSENKYKHKTNPTNAQITMISEPSSAPIFISYDAKYFNPRLSESDLAKGKGLVSQHEQALYQRFVKANTNIIENYREAAKKLRHCKDISMIEKYESWQMVQPCLLGLFSNKEQLEYKINELISPEENQFKLQ